MKKTIYALVTALLLSSAYAQTSDTTSGDQAGDDNMIESNIDSLVRGSLNFDKSKTRGKEADNDTQLDLVLNYARKFSKQWQWGTRLNYKKDTSTPGDTENYGFQVGVFYNFSENLQEALYLSLFTGLEWDHIYGRTQFRDEVWKSTFAVGKRFGLARWKVAHLVYSPEIAFQTANSTTGSKGSNLEYSQSVQFRFLQFSLFF
ncbi:MAG: hypothetical protein ACJ76H_10645 [Bacteriovoracaceae bacterium]